MATVGVDCHIILDSQGYYLAPHTYQVQRPRVRKSTLTLTGVERVLDLGPGKHVWRFVILALNDLSAYGGGPVGMSGQQIRAAAQASYAKVATTMSFIDPHGDAYTVRFDGLAELVRDLRTQVLSPGYLLACELVEA